MKTIKKKIKRQVKYFTCGKNELEKINEGLQHRNIDADSVISITDSGECVNIWYRVEPKIDRLKIAIKKYGINSDFMRAYHAMRACIIYDKDDEFFEKWGIE
jgi:hypothetical protein